MIFRILAMTVLSLFFSPNTIFISSEIINNPLTVFKPSISNQSITLFMPADSLIILEADSSNDESC